MNQRKWKKYRISKHKFPSKYVDDSFRYGKESAQRELEKQLGRPVRDMKFKSERFSWCWMEPI